MLHALPRWFRTTEPPRIFVHHSNVLTRGMRALGEGEVVEFDLAEHNSSPVAVGVTAPGGKAVSGTLAHRRVPAERVAKHIARLESDDEMAEVLASLDWSAVSWTKLMGQLVRQGLPLRALEVLTFMPSAGIELDYVAYTVGITACGAAGDVDRALELLQKIRDQAARGEGSPPDIIAYAMAVDACAKAGRLEDARELVTQLRADGLEPNHVVQQILITAFGEAGDLTAASECLAEYTRSGASVGGGCDTVSNSPYVAFFAAACSCNAPERVVDVLRELSESCAVGPRLGTYISALNIVDGHSAEACQQVLDYLVDDAIEKLVRGQTADYDFDEDEDEDEEDEGELDEGDERQGEGSTRGSGSVGGGRGREAGTHPVRHQVPRILRAAGKTIGRSSSDGRMLSFVERIVDGASARGALVPHAVMRNALSAGDARNAEAMLVLMRELELEPGTEDYNIAMSIARASRFDEMVIVWWEEMAEYALDPDWFTCTQVVSAALRAGRPEVVEDVWGMLSEDADVVMMQRHLTMYTTIMRVLGERNNAPAICSLLQRILEDGIEMDGYAFRTAFMALEACNHWEGMKWSYAYGCTKSRIPNDVDIKMVYAALDNGEWKLAMKAIERVTRNFHRADKGRRSPGGVARLNRMRRAHRACTVAMSRFTTPETVGNVLDVMGLMWSSKLHPNHITYSAALKSAAQAHAPHVVETLLDRLDRDLQDGLVSTHVITLTHAVAAAGAAGDEEAVERWISRAEALGEGDEIIYTVAVEAASDCNNVDLAVAFVERMRTRGLQPNAHTYSALIDCLGKRGLVDEAMAVFQEACMLLDERDVMTYNATLGAVANGGRYELIASLLEQMKADNVVPNATTEKVIQRILSLLDGINVEGGHRVGSFSALQRRTVSRALQLEAAAAAKAEVIKVDSRTILDTLPALIESDTVETVSVPVSP